MSHADEEGEKREIMLDLAQQAVNFCLLKLIDLGLISLNEVNGKWYIQFDESRLESKGFGAAATLDIEGIPVMYLLPTLNVRGLARAISHESVHLMQLCRGDLVPRLGCQIWRGVAYKTLPADSPDYFEAQPWEQEARDLQPMLLDVLRQKGFQV